MQRGVQQVLRGVQKIKGKKEGERRAWAWVWDWVWAWTGSGWERVYKGCWPNFSHFSLLFLSLPLSRERSSLLSPSFHEEHGGALPRSRRVSRRWGGFPAVVGRPVRRRTTPETYFFYIFFLISPPILFFSLSLFPFLRLEFQKKVLFVLDLKRENYFCCA